MSIEKIIKQKISLKFKHEDGKVYFSGAIFHGKDQ